MGDGKSIDVWTDPWVSWIEGFKPRLRIEDYYQLPIKAHHLLDHTSTAWNEDMVKEVFESMAAQAILTIPIPHSPRQDKLIWLPDSKGAFSVRSVHQVAFTHSSSSNQDLSHWKNLWKARLPECLKMLLWRIGANAIPTRENIQRRIHHVDPSCILCNAEVERSSHLFFESHFARALWANSGWGLRINSDLLNSGEDILNLILNPPNAPVPANERWTISLNMALIIEEMWKARNLKLFQYDQPILSKAMMNVNAKFQELSKVYPPLIHTNPATTNLPTWIPPPTDHVKINVDAALDSSKSALAVVARNYRGDVLFIWGKVHHLCSPLQAEASALLWAVQLAT